MSKASFSPKIKDIASVNPLHNIIIKGARVHNLKNIDLVIPRDKLVVITGLSGSGKSSLAFETLYAEGQRRYVESLSSYARQFLGRLDKPDVDWIRGISPAVAIEQKVNSRNPRSTVGTSTEIYDYLKLLFSRVGETYSPETGALVKKHIPSDVADAMRDLAEGTRIVVTCPVEFPIGIERASSIETFLLQGFSRVWYENRIVKLSDLPSSESSFDLLVGRQISSKAQEVWDEVADFAQTAMLVGGNRCDLHFQSSLDGRYTRVSFSGHFESGGQLFEIPFTHMFAFNNPVGACSRCEGFGTVLGIDEDMVIPNPALSVYQGAVACWKGEKMGEWKSDFILASAAHRFPIHRPYVELNESERLLLWEGASGVYGINDFFKYVEQNLYKIQYRVLLSRYRGKTVCSECKGTRLRKDAGYVKVNGLSIMDMVLMPVDKLLDWFNSWSPSPHIQELSKRLTLEIKNRLRFLVEVGLGYLTLNRLSLSLSGGESQRINLATSLGSSLVGSMYILDEPSIGLHPRDTDRLVNVVNQLRDEGNTVIVVEHDESFMRAADVLVDIGPDAGSGGGEIVFCGTFKDLSTATRSYTADYLLGRKSIPIPDFRRKSEKVIEIKGARENNLKGIDVVFPLEVFVAVTGVSGSGKTSLVKQVFFPALKRALGKSADKMGKHISITGDIDFISDVLLVDQNPIGRSSRSNPVTYLKVYEDIRALYAAQPIAKALGLKPSHFSFNLPGGRCDHCEGEGQVTIEMQFMADIVLQCDVCDGKRFKEEVLEVVWEDKNISELLAMSVDEAIDFFKLKEPKISYKLKPLSDVGLGYIKLGQPSSTLSGGEAQRVKLAWFLSRGTADGKILFIFDEPTTGLHVHDVGKLLDAFRALLKQGHSVLVIEHHMDVIKCADWIIDLGPDGGELGGHLLFAGVPEALVLQENSYTGIALKTCL
jgi:excinuclease ABC subunit A